MQVRIFDDMEQCTDDEVNRMLSLVSDQRREQALKYKFTFGRFACLKSAVMLQQMLTSMGWLNDGDCVTFTYGEHGKPSIVGQPNICFNISHCKNAIAVAVNDRPVGIDVECFRHADEALLHRTMNDDECATILASVNPDETFVNYWTQKEAVFKLRGTGITDEIRDVLSQSERCETHIHTAKQYAWTVATFQ